jgi:very-short-patch-repair endonuclease
MVSRVKVEDSALRLARYLKEFVGLRTTTVRDVTKYESVLWFGDMPQDPDCRSGAWTDDHESGAPWLEVKKQEFGQPPAPPEAILPWVDERALKRATPEPPVLRPTILLPDDQVDAAEESASLVEHSLEDHPEVQQAYARYLPAWTAWSTEYRRREAIQRVYAELFRLHTQVHKQGEIIEVVLGLGLLDWQAPLNDKVVPIRRHVFVARVELEFDAAKGVIRVVAPGDGARVQIEDDMLEAELRPDRTYYSLVEAQLEELGDDVWDKARMHNALKTWAGALTADAQWSPGLEAQAGGSAAPLMTFTPALIMRRRSQTGMVRIYDALIDQLSNDLIDVPEGWAGLVDDLGDQVTDVNRGHPETHDGYDPEEPAELYFPLVANREQQRIASAIERHRGVLVQGPPGTGKSHTIANLICHLLATGKRVLITAETGRALQVLKNKLPKDIQPLCVSLLGQGGDSFAELNAAVQGITTRQAAYSAADYETRLSQVESDLEEARRRLAEIDSELGSLRAEETCLQSVAGGTYRGTASAIAARVGQEREQYAWLSLPKDALVWPPLPTDEVTTWFAIRRRYADQEISDAKLQIPSSRALPAPSDFATAVEAEKASATALAQQEERRCHPAYASIQALPPDTREQLRTGLSTLEGQQLALGPIEEDWRRAALQDCITQRRARWDTLIELSRDRLATVDTLLTRIGDWVVQLPASRDARRVRADAAVALSHFQKGGKWKVLGLVTPRTLKSRVYLKHEVLVDGAGAADSERLQIVCDDLDLQYALADLDSAWADVGARPAAGDRRLRIAVLKEQLRLLEQVCEYVDACGRLAASFAAGSPSIPLPNWQQGEALTWIELIDAAAVEDRHRDATCVVTSAITSLSPLRELHDASPIIEALTAAIEGRDIGGYSHNYARVVAIETTRVDQEHRLRIEEALSAAVPGLPEEAAKSIDPSVWERRLATWEEAWRWAVAKAWLEKRSDFEYQQNLWKRRHETDQQVGRLLGEAAALRAWTHFFDRLSPHEAAALKSWREAVRAMGKGTGQSARMARLRQEARRYMDACREAIPVWIMPRYLVAEMIEPGPERYDLVIVDEASQLGIESLFLFYVAKQMVVVGDDQQISPYGVGIADDAIAKLQRHYLDGVPHQHALSPQSSLYANAKIRFSQNIVLREHFRCMPEIIQFSNDLCYASNGTSLDPLRAYPANRLQPLVVRHVADGHRSGTNQSAQNLPEADAIVAQIAACIEDPRYTGASIGVISLQGEAQAKLIERKLLERLDPEVIEARRLICGDAYAFQGDERNIVFLSMVAAPGPMRIGALSNESARQRFNVAVSRAQDQLWLFHTATLDALSEACMRRRLLSYMLDPARRTTEEVEHRFESDFERDVFRMITRRGFHVRTQVCVGEPTSHRYRIDLVVEGMQGRLAVECDGDQWHGPERYAQDMARQRDLERAGWQFARIRGGDFYRDPEEALRPVWAELDRLGIRPGGIDVTAAEPPAPLVLETFDGTESALLESGVSEPHQTPNGLKHEAPPTQSATEPVRVDLNGATQELLHEAPEPALHCPTRESGGQYLLFSEFNSPSRTAVCRTRYVIFEGQSGPDPRHASPARVAEGLCGIIEVEGPMVAKRAYDTYLRVCGISRMGGEIRRSMNKALHHAIRTRKIVTEDEFGTGGLVYSVVRSVGVPPVLVRQRGPRAFEEIPPSELQLVARTLAKQDDLELGSDAHLRAVLAFFDHQRLTVQVRKAVLKILSRRYSYVDEICP